MVILIILAAVLIIAGVLALMITGNEVSRQKKEIAHLEQLQLGAVAQLEDLEKQTKTLEGTEKFFQNKRAQLREKRDALAGELDRLEEELGPEHDIAVDDRLEDSPMEDGDEEAGPPKEGKKPAAESQPQRDIKVRQPMGSKPLDFEDSTSG